MGLQIDSISVPFHLIENGEKMDDMIAYRALDIFFTVFHTCLVIFNVFGWILKKTRPLNLICLLLTAGSWLFLGLFYGFGYCPLTESHFNVLEKLGYTNLPTSYMSFLFTRLSHLQIDQSLVDNVTLWGLIISLILSLYLNLRQL